jgi:dihydroorotase
MSSTRRVVKIAERYDKKIHVLHVSTKEEIDFLAMHKKNVTFEITPQHLTIFAPECYDKLGTFAQMNPPIRSKEHYDKLWIAVRNNIVDILGSDHAPHLKENKNKKYPQSPSGMPGVQTILPIMLDHVNNKKLTLNQLVKFMCENPCKIFGIKNKGYIKEGFDADLTIIDMNKTQVIKNEMIASKCGWTPFNDYKVRGFPVGTIVNGNIVMSEGKIISKAEGKPLEF